MRVINSTFQVVRIAFHGAKLSQRRLPLQTEELGIDDPELKRRIGASFKLFETDIDLFTRGLQEDLVEIKRQYNLKPMGDVGHLVLSRDRAGLDLAVGHLKRKYAGLNTPLNVGASQLNAECSLAAGRKRADHP